MNCVEIQELLSAYHDGELKSDIHNSITEHLKVCPECAATLANFEQLSELSVELKSPAAPDQWAAIEKQLAAAPAANPAATKSRASLIRGATQSIWLKRSLSRSSLAIAATLLIAAGIAVGTHYGWFSRADLHDRQLAATFDAFLNQFEQNPQAAEQVLLTSYAGHEMDLPAATKLLGYQPAVARGLPPGYSVDAVYVLNMPCCKCSQVVCRRQGNGPLAIFEHEVDQPCWFGNRPAIDAQCCGKPTRIVELENNLLAATWKSSKRYVTVIGARDVKEVTQLVSYFEGPNQSS